MAAVARGSGTDTVNTGHGCDSTTTTNVCSGNVLVNGKGVCRKGDAITSHNQPSGELCVPHTPTITAGSSSVFVNGIAIARNGDAADAGAISSGSGNVFAG